MTHDLLQSDIALATRLREEQRPDEEIVAALVHRGVDSGKAAQLLDDLRNGRNVRAHSTLPLEFGLARRSRVKRDSHRSGPSQPSRSAEAETRRKSPSRAATGGGRLSPVRWLIPALLVVLMAAGGLFFLSRRNPAPAGGSKDQNRPAALAVRGDNQPRSAPANAATPDRGLRVTPLSLALEPDGLHLGGALVSRNSLLTALAGVLGAATRTNQARQTGALIYAFDHEGVLVYAQASGGADSIVLDCDASGGIHGTTSAFAGTLAIDGQAISPDTDPQTLTAIKQLGLSHPGSHSGVWGGHYNSLELVFAYLKSTRRLSLIEIDFK